MKYVCSKNYKILCKEDCYHVKNIKPENMVWFDTLDQGIEYGCRPCKHCLSEKEMLQMKQLDVCKKCHHDIECIATVMHRPELVVKCANFGCLKEYVNSLDAQIEHCELTPCTTNPFEQFENTSFTFTLDEECDK